MPARLLRRLGARAGGPRSRPPPGRCACRDPGPTPAGTRASTSGMSAVEVLGQPVRGRVGLDRDHAAADVDADRGGDDRTVGRDDRPDGRALADVGVGHERDVPLDEREPRRSLRPARGSRHRARPPRPSGSCPRAPACRRCWHAVRPRRTGLRDGGNVLPRDHARDRPFRSRRRVEPPEPDATAVGGPRSTRQFGWPGSSSRDDDRPRAVGLVRDLRAVDRDALVVVVVGVQERVPEAQVPERALGRASRRSRAPRPAASSKPPIA